jgi:hypothetical protein
LPSGSAARQDNQDEGGQQPAAASSAAAAALDRQRTAGVRIGGMAFTVVAVVAATNLFNASIDVRQADPTLTASR